MIKEKKQFVWRAFGSNWAAGFWKDINKLFDEGWRACANRENKRDLAPILAPNRIVVTLERDDKGLTLEHIKTLTKVKDFEDFCNEHNVVYDKDLKKSPVKFKKFVREYFENIDEKESECVSDTVVENIFLNADSFKPINK